MVWFAVSVLTSVVGSTISNISRLVILSDGLVCSICMDKGSGVYYLKYLQAGHTN